MCHVRRHVGTGDGLWWVAGGRGARVQGAAGEVEFEVEARTHAWRTVTRHHERILDRPPRPWQAVPVTSGRRHDRQRLGARRPRRRKLGGDHAPHAEPHDVHATPANVILHAECHYRPDWLRLRRPVAWQWHTAVHARGGGMHGEQFLRALAQLRWW